MTEGERPGEEAPQQRVPPWWPGAPGEQDPQEPSPPKPEGGGLQEPEPWCRLSPLTQITEPVRYLKSFLVPLLAALFVGSFNPVVLVSAGIALLGFLLGGHITWRTVYYQVGAERLEIRRGLVNRSRRTIPLERIRGVDVTSTPLHRVLGLAVVRVEAAAGGGEAEEGKLDAVSTAEAERLRRVLLHRRAILQGRADGAAPDTAESAPTAAETEEAAGPVYFTMPRRGYLYGVLSLGYLLTPFVALAALLGFLGQIARDVDLDIDADQARGLVERLFDSPRSVLLTVGIVAALALLVLMPVFAVASYAINHWNFVLRRRDDALVTERGLFTRRSVTLEMRRIRGYELVDTPLQRLAATIQLRAIVTGLGEASTRAALLPLARRSQVHRVIAQTLSPFLGELHSHPTAARHRRLFRAITPFLVIAAVGASLGSPLVAGAAFVMAVLGVPLGLDRYRSLGHGYDGRRISVRSGSLRRSQAVVDRGAVIGWRWHQTLFQRRSDLATLEASVGAGSGGYSAIDADFAESVAFTAGVTPRMVRPFLVTGEHAATGE